MIETERLLLRRFTLDDLPTLIEQRLDEEVARYIGGLELQTPEFVEKRLRTYLANYEKHGFGVCAMIWKETGENIGWSGIQPLEDSGEIEVGYGLIKEFWCRGIGFECAMAWLRFGFETVGLERIVAVAVKGNTGSIRIMEKCGMTFDGEEVHYGLPVVHYSVTREVFAKLHDAH